MGEQRFKVGDWVRVKDNCGAPLDYKIGDICQVSAVRKDLVYCGDAAMFAKRFEPWQPRVGERVCVKVIANSQWAGDGEVTDLRNGGVIVVLMKTGKFAGKPGGFYVRDLEPIRTTTATEQSATLKIETGKFYKTRDGRKVGPMRVDGPAWTPNGGAHWYREDGSRYYACDRGGDTDLIAEWIDEPVAEPSNDNVAPKFKVGDVVIDTESSEGYTGVVRAISNDHFKIEWLEDGKPCGTTGTWPYDDFELVSAPPTTTIVALIENGQPKPSSTPHVHASPGAAETEAKRLAAKYKGKQFGVFTLTATYHEPKPVYDHKWQNMAAMGLKIDAIKELRAVAGLDLLSAKRAVEAFDAAA